MPPVITLMLGFAAGLHAAAYGAYKDSPHESFLLRRFIREIVLATFFAASFVLLGLDESETPFILYLSFFALTRIATEFWKLFVRVEPQEGYRIPTQIHWVKGVVHNRAVRLLLGVGFLASIYGIFALGTLFLNAPTPLRGLLVGLAIGFAEAIAGAYKDGSIEGFHKFKFFKSPTFGALGGLIASGHTGNILSLLLASIGTMRMLLELVFKMVVPGYVPGKFRSMDGPYVEWTARRRLFLAPYFLTWALYLVLATHPKGIVVDLLASPRPTSVEHVAIPDQATDCTVGFAPSFTRDYLLRARVRPVLFWMGWHRIGNGRFTASGPMDGDHRAEFLVKTDPDRAPMRLNRSGFVAESICADALGSSHADTGFLATVMSLMDEAVASDRHGRVEPGKAFSRLYVYDGRTYELLAHPARPASASTARHSSEQLLDIHFTIQDVARNPVASFDLTLGPVGDEAHMPLRVVYRSHWWLELELLPTSATANR